MGSFNELLFEAMKSDMTDIYGLSVESGISEEKIRSFLNGEIPHIHDAQSIARVLGVSVNSIFKSVKEKG